LFPEVSAPLLVREASVLTVGGPPTPAGVATLGAPAPRHLQEKFRFPTFALPAPLLGAE